MQDERLAVAAMALQPDGAPTFKMQLGAVGEVSLIPRAAMAHFHLPPPAPSNYSAPPRSDSFHAAVDWQSHALEAAAREGLPSSVRERAVELLPQGDKTLDAQRCAAARE